MEREQLIKQQCARRYDQQECNIAWLDQRPSEHCALVWIAEELADGRQPEPVLDEL